MAERRGSRVSFFSPAKRELRQPRPADDAGAGQQPLHDRPHGGGAEHQRFLAAAPVQHAIGEDVAALEIGGELDFVDGEERDVEIARHRLDGGDPEARIRRLDLLLAGDQRHRVGADPLDRAVVDLARQQPQRQADHAGRMRQHPLDGEMGLAGIGRPEHGGDAGAAGAQITIGGRREGNRHRRPGRAATERRRLHLYHNNTRESPVLKVWNESGTNRGRIGDSRRVRLRSLRHMAATSRNTRSGVEWPILAVAARQNS